MTRLNFLREELERLREEGLLRERLDQSPDGRQLIVACSNDYLGYGSELVSRETLSRCTERLGAGASRLVSGTSEAHQILERRIADWMGTEAALLFSSGYLANSSAISALAGPKDSVFSDRLNHASIVDGCRLSQAKLHIYDHLNLEHLEHLLRKSPTVDGKRLIVTESYFSMDGDSPDFARLDALCRTYSAALFVDEAHALGVFGEKGVGVARQAGVNPDITVGTLGKAVGSSGAFVTGSGLLCDWLWNRARGFVFSTALSPLLCRLTIERLERLTADDAGRSKLRQLSDQFAFQLSNMGFELKPGRHGPIFPLLIGSANKAVNSAANLRKRGFLVQAIRPPTVPEGTSRLRIVLTSAFDPELLEQLAAALSDSLLE